MTKAEYMDARKAAMEAMSTEDFAITIGEYFDKHITRPGEKDLKEAAEKIVANIAENPVFTITDEVKSAMAERFAEIVVREMKVEQLAVRNLTSENENDFSVLKPCDLCLRKTGSVEAEGKSPAKTFYEAEATIIDGNVLVKDNMIGAIGKKFMKNNTGTKIPATLFAVDYSNGKMKNMSYTVVADIADIAA